MTLETIQKNYSWINFHEIMAVDSEERVVRNFNVFLNKSRRPNGYWDQTPDILNDNLYISTMQNQSRSMFSGNITNKPPFVQSMIIKGMGGNKYYQDREEDLRKILVIDIDLTEEEKSDIENPSVWSRAIQDADAVARSAIRRYGCDGATIMVSGGGFYVVIWPKQHNRTELDRDFWFAEVDAILEDAGVSLKHSSDKTTMTYRGVFRMPYSLNRKYPTKMTPEGYPKCKPILEGGWKQIMRGRIHPWLAITPSRLTVRTVKI